MKVNELLNSMNKDFRESLWDIFINDVEIEDPDDPNVFEKEVSKWYIEPPYIEGRFFCMKMVIYTKDYLEELE